MNIKRKRDFENRNVSLRLNECLLTQHRTGSSTGACTNSVFFSVSFLHPSSFLHFLLCTPCISSSSYSSSFISVRDPPPEGSKHHSFLFLIPPSAILPSSSFLLL